MSAALLIDSHLDIEVWAVAYRQLASQRRGMSHLARREHSFTWARKCSVGHSARDLRAYVVQRPRRKRPHRFCPRSVLIAR